MIKTLIVGDTHGRSFWKLVKDFDRLVFIGDYFDSFDIFPESQINNFLDILEFKRSSDKEIVLLIGNHDFHYFPEIGDCGYSGYKTHFAPSIGYILNENKKELQMAYKFDNFLCTHAGVTKTWLKNNGYFDGDGIEENNTCLSNIDDFINDMWKYKPNSFHFNGSDPYGDDITQSPIWVRPRSLMKDSKDLGYIQIVGHTTQNQIDIKGKSTGGKYYFIDTLGTSGECLCIENNNITTEILWKIR